MTVMPELEELLVAAAERQRGLVTAQCPVAPRSVRRRPWRSGLRGGALVLAGVVVSGTALAATGVWSPQLGDDHRARPTASDSSAPTVQLGQIGVLRQPATAADHGTQVRHALRYLDRHTTQGIRTSQVRLLSASGRGFVLIPVAHSDLGEPSADAAKRDALCLFANDVEGGTMSCYTTAEILANRSSLLTRQPAPMSAADLAKLRKASKAAHGRAFTVPGLQPRSGGSETVSGLVPNGVARVEVSDGASAGGALVANNFYTVTLAAPRQGEGAARGPSVRWFDGDGREVTPH